MIIINPNRTKELIEQLISLWEESVIASHHFLNKQDIEKLIPFVRIGINSIDKLIVKYEVDTPTAFMGIEGNKIEMLFVSSNYFRNGIGKELMNYAINNLNIKFVDVNEQNPNAFEFYEYMGFRTFERSELDDQGNPFPILKMKLHSTN